MVPPDGVTSDKPRRRRAGGQLPLLLQHCALALRQRRESLVTRNRAAQLVKIPGAFRFRRLFHLEQIGRMDGAAVWLHLALAEKRIVGRERLHFVHELGALVWLAATR